jgi:hypothetical protein
LGLGGTETRAQDRAFQFALLGDLPYSKIEEQELRHLIAMMNGIDLAFVVHWVKVTVDPADRQLFRFEPQIVPENVGNHRPK